MSILSALPWFSQNRIVHMNSVKSISENFNSLSDNVKKDILLYGDPRLDENKNKVLWIHIFDLNFFIKKYPP